MRKPDNCKTCGKHIDGKKYNPYNESFEFYECKEDEKKMCLPCAEKFVTEQNKYKGGRWVLRECETKSTVRMEEITLVYAVDMPQDVMDWFQENTDYPLHYQNEIISVGAKSYDPFATWLRKNGYKFKKERDLIGIIAT